MAEYIEREALKKKFCEWCNKEYEDEPCEPDECPLRTMIIEAHAADVVEVVHGEWINDFGSYSTMHCSKCEWRVPYIEDYWAIQELYSSLHNCPNCGAKMDGDTK